MDVSRAFLEQCRTVDEAMERIRGHVHRTPVMSSRFIDSLAGAKVFFKCENFQRMGAFKIRGATNAIKHAVAQGATSVITHSSGNHGQAVALAAREQGIPATIIMPHDTAKVKIDAVRGYGGDIVLCEPGTAAREKMLADIMATSDAKLIHPYNDELVIAGQGTAARELIEDAGAMDVLMVPVSGGGLLAGTALAAKGSACIYGAEPEQANDAALSLAAGRIVSLSQVNTIADGLRSSSLGTRNFPIIQQSVQDILTVSEAEIVAAMRLVWERMKLVIEASSAVPVAALIRYGHLWQGRRVGIVLSGGNVDLSHLPW